MYLFLLRTDLYKYIYNIYIKKSLHELEIHTIRSLKKKKCRDG